ncbi:hypothetical protein COO60DRAFT_174790 [Scenedesmus sp. NREL 46B-D3]|nr:hypothetical protein COO60DRAFT_174790 [Scenedesmus sp. NREL 46B-D3]
MSIVLQQECNPLPTAVLDVGEPVVSHFGVPVVSCAARIPCTVCQGVVCSSMWLLMTAASHAAFAAAPDQLLVYRHMLEQLACQLAHNLGVSHQQYCCFSMLRVPKHRPRCTRPHSLPIASTAVRMETFYHQRKRHHLAPKSIARKPSHNCTLPATLALQTRGCYSFFFLLLFFLPCYNACYSTSARL